MDTTKMALITHLRYTNIHTQIHTGPRKSSCWEMALMGIALGVECYEFRISLRFDDFMSFTVRLRSLANIKHRCVVFICFALRIVQKVLRATLDVFCRRLLFKMAAVSVRTRRATHQPLGVLSSFCCCVCVQTCSLPVRAQNGDNRRNKRTRARRRRRAHRKILENQSMCTSS